MSAATNYAASGANATAAAGAFDTLQSLVADDLEKVNDVIRARMRSDAAPLIPELAAHLIEAGGKRLRPILTLASAQLCGYAAGADHVKLAAAVEFIHTATLLHDDVVDESEKRRSRPTANLLWGNKPSILVGDFLFSRAFQLMVETNSIEVLKTLSDASAIIAEGEVLQLSTANTISGDDAIYMQVIRAKTAALFEAATLVGAMVAGAGDAERAAMARYGDALGVSFQLVDDALDYGGVSQDLGKSVGDDFREGKPTLPAILAYRAAETDEDKAFWTRCIARRRQEEGDLERAIDLMRATGALQATIDRAESEARAAQEALSVFPDGRLKSALSDIAAFVVSRAS